MGGSGARAATFGCGHADADGARMHSRTEAQKDGRRLVVMWLCWVLLALFLIAAGVVVW